MTVGARRATLHHSLPGSFGGDRAPSGGPPPVPYGAHLRRENPIRRPRKPAEPEEGSSLPGVRSQSEGPGDPKAQSRASEGPRAGSRDLEAHEPAQRLRSSCHGSKAEAYRGHRE
ncbi:hypothetical protein OsI_38632 [Oryza sativa Indica Group]|uniref:Uncharacterized protein n=1 Tax=Oryza sativa subsp. indica TaxID=39946 RepID=A2ZLD5_ORYSI|nr:hypothetical protein OsI_38632 [Oryza sativa Indica Group]